MLLVALMVALVSFASSGINAVWRHLAYDDRPAMVFHDVRLVDAVLASGAPLAFEMRYSKRAECHPPHGTSEIAFRVWHYPAAAPPFFRWVSYVRPSRAPAGVNVSLSSPTVIPMPSLEAGLYGFQIRATYKCASASAEQVVDSPIVPYTVTATDPSRPILPKGIILQ